MNRMTLMVLILASAVYPAVLQAHGPSRQKVEREVHVAAPAEKVWGLIADFCSISTWNPEVTACEAEPGNKVGTIRTITLKSGEKMKEQLRKYEPDKMQMRILLVEPNEKAMPINTLGILFGVSPADDGGCTVTWKAGFYRSFPGPTPPPELSDEAAVRAVSEFVDTGLASLKAMAEK